MAKNSVAKNYIYNLIYQIMTMIIPLITTPYLSRILGAENIGIYSYTLSIATYFILFGSLGLNLYGQREIAYVQNDVKKRSLIFFEIFIIKCITLFISLILFYFFFCRSGQYLLYYRILVLEILANMIDIAWLFQGLEEFKKIVIRSVLVKLISVICIFILIHKPSDLYLYFIIFVMSTFIGNLSLLFYAPKYIDKIDIHKLELTKHFKPAISLFIPQIAIQIYTVLDKTMLGTIISDKAEVGYYEQAIKVVKLLMMLATSLGTVMMPRIASIFSKGDLKQLKKYMKKSFSFIMMLAFPISLGLVSIANKFVPIFFGNGYEKVIPLIYILSPIIVIIGLSNIIGNQFFLPTKQQKKYTISVIIGAIVNFILNLFFITRFQSLGAAFATVIAEFCVTFSQFVLVKDFISIFEVLKLTYKYIVCSIIMFAISILIGLIINNYCLSIFVQIIVSIFVYFISLILLRDNLILEGKNIIFNKLKSINN